MKNSTLILLAVLFAISNFVSSVFAQTAANTTKSTTKSAVKEMTSRAPFETEGVRLTLFKPNHAVTAKASSRESDNSFEESGSVDEGRGITLGYVSLPIGQVGWIAQASMLEFDDENFNEKIGILRLEGNVAYAVNPVMTMAAGLNVARITAGEQIFQDLNPGVGIQTRFTMNLSPRIGIELAYSTMHMEDTLRLVTDIDQFGNPITELVGVDFQFSGLELGLNAMF